MEFNVLRIIPNLSLPANIHVDRAIPAKNGDLTAKLQVVFSKTPQIEGYEAISSILTVYLQVDRPKA